MWARVDGVFENLTTEHQSQVAGALAILYLSYQTLPKEAGEAAARQVMAIARKRRVVPNKTTMLSQHMQILNQREHRLVWQPQPQQQQQSQ